MLNATDSTLSHTILRAKRFISPKNFSEATIDMGAELPSYNSLIDFLEELGFTDVTTDSIYWGSW